ncbi:MAG TPA: M55 family metallopeptidase [Acidobacteriota bacterium]|nr:M55 family metallopeptidase [Acidobacteriota bacterium]
MRQSTQTQMIRMALAVALIFMATAPSGAAARAQDPLKVFISVDMEGIGGIGTSAMTGAGGKGYELGRQLMTEEVNTVAAAILEHGPAEILVNDSHGSMNNVLHTLLDPRVEYIQGNIKPLGMVQGLDDSFDAAIFLGYHARARTAGGFLAHTGSGSVKGLWMNGVEVGEGGMNAYYAGSHGVPVIVAAGDLAFTEQFSELVGSGTRTVATKEAIGAQVARLDHPEVVRVRLHDATLDALANLSAISPLVPDEPIAVRMRFATTTRADIVQAVPDTRRVDGTTVEYTARNMTEGYMLVRLMYKYISW